MFRIGRPLDRPPCWHSDPGHTILPLAGAFSPPGMPVFHCARPTRPSAERFRLLRRHHHTCTTFAALPHRRGEDCQSLRRRQWPPTLGARCHRAIATARLLADTSRPGRCDIIYPGCACTRDRTAICGSGRPTRPRPGLVMATSVASRFKFAPMLGEGSPTHGRPCHPLLRSFRWRPEVTPRGE